MSKRVLPGLANATSYFQSSVEPLFRNLRGNMKAWLDGFTLHARDENQPLELLDRFFTICQDHNLFLSARRSVLFSRTIRWCGRIIDQHGYQMDPSRISALQNMNEPETAAELPELSIAAAGWPFLSLTSQPGPPRL